MDLSKVKLIVSDMDGTLLNSNHQMSDLFFKQFKELKKNNIKFVAASGRQYHSIVDKLKTIKKDITIVAENGAYVVENGKELFSNGLESKDVRTFVDMVEKIPNTNIVLAGKKRAYFLETSKELENTVAEFYSEYTLLPNFNVLPNDTILKIACYNANGSETAIYPLLKHLKDKWQIKVSGQFWLDIALPSNHKGTAIERIQKELSISVDETMAFGDYQNDVEMLKKAKFSFAMENAHQDVLETANYKTLSNDNMGVETMIGKLIEVI